MTADRDVAKTVNTNRERAKATPDAADLKNAKEVWKDGETVPSRNRTEAPSSGMVGRVADAGDIDGGTPSPYGTEVQSDAVIVQRPGDGIEHPVRTFSEQRREAENKLTDARRNKR